VKGRLTKFCNKSFTKEEPQGPNEQSSCQTSKTGKGGDHMAVRKKVTGWQHRGGGGDY